LAPYRPRAENARLRIQLEAPPAGFFTPQEIEALSKAQSIACIRDAGALPAMAILNRKQLPDGSVELEVELVPSLAPAPIRLRRFGGQWKITSSF
jgi:hypothetical protein